MRSPQYTTTVQPPAPSFSSPPHATTHHHHTPPGFAALLLLLQARAKKKTRKRPWKSEEVNALLAGVESHNTRWNEILKGTMADVFQEGRTAAELKDKWERRAKKKHTVEEAAKSEVRNTIHHNDHG